MHQFINNISPSNLTLSAYIVSSILIDDLSISEQNSLGNYLELLGQIILTNAAQQKVLNNKYNSNNKNMSIK